MGIASSLIAESVEDRKRFQPDVQPDGNHVISSLANVGLQPSKQRCAASESQLSSTVSVPRH
jgi:hypothetical protein